jgi:hypothetical protein
VHAILKHPQPLFFPYCERTRHTHTKQLAKLYFCIL